MKGCVIFPCRLFKSLNPILGCVIIELSTQGGGTANFSVVAEAASKVYISL